MVDFLMKLFGVGKSFFGDLLLLGVLSKLFCLWRLCNFKLNFLSYMSGGDHISLVPFFAIRDNMVVYFGGDTCY